jgi:uncharacterized RDD family membrane protein YckC
MKIYLERDNQQFGPFTEAVARQHISEGRFRSHDRGWIEGMPEWADISAIPALANALHANHSAPPPPASTSFASAHTAPVFSAYSTALAPATSEIVGHDAVEAGFWRRSAALIIDLVMVMIVLGILSIPFAILGFNGFRTFGVLFEFTGFSGSPESWFGALFMAGYFAFWHASVYAASPGKMLFGVVTLNAQTHQRIELPQAIIREIARIIAVIPLGLSYWFQPFTQRRQTLHDMVAGSVVLRKSADAGAPSVLVWIVNILIFGVFTAALIVAVLYFLF